MADPTVVREYNDRATLDHDAAGMMAAGYEVVSMTEQPGRPGGKRGLLAGLFGLFSKPKPYFVATYRPAPAPPAAPPPSVSTAGRMSARRERPLTTFAPLPNRPDTVTAIACPACSTPSQLPGGSCNQCGQRLPG
jgi:hypothetical protein